jgi:hypothetical protein
LNRRILEVTGVPDPDETAADGLLRPGQPVVAEVQERTDGSYVVRSVHGWIALGADPVETGPSLWLEPAAVARALPGVTRVERIDGDEPCALLSMRVERPALRRVQDLEVRLRRCSAPRGDVLRWVARSESVVKQETGESVDLPYAFLDAIDLKRRERYGWLLGVRRVEWGRPLGPVFSRIYSEELRAELARTLRHAAPLLAGDVGGAPDSTSRIE